MKLAQKKVKNIYNKKLQILLQAPYGYQTFGKMHVLLIHNYVMKDHMEIYPHFNVKNAKITHFPQKIILLVFLLQWNVIRAQLEIQY